MTSTPQIILSLQQDEWSTEPRFFLICWCRDWRRDRWGQKKYQWTCRWEVWPPHCRRTPLPSQSPHRSRCEMVWCWASGWWTALFGRRTQSDRAGWGTSSHGRGLRWSCPSCWLTCWPLPGPNQSSHQRPPRQKATQRQALHLRVEYKYPPTLITDLLPPSNVALSWSPAGPAHTPPGQNAPDCQGSADAARHSTPAYRRGRWWGEGGLCRDLRWYQLTHSESLMVKWYPNHVRFYYNLKQKNHEIPKGSNTFSYIRINNCNKWG